MGAEGFVYVPESCSQQKVGCRLHIALHGCQQSPIYVQDAFISHAGYNEWAETNGIVVLYPIARSVAGNPSACWDWWGYTGQDYLTYNGKQNQVIKGIVGKLFGSRSR